jgi:hypothetical protein
MIIISQNLNLKALKNYKNYKKYKNINLKL